MTDTQRPYNVYRFMKHLDTGYMKVCLKCHKTFGEKKAMIGKVRDLEMSLCPPCDDKPKKRNKLGSYY